MQRMYKTVWFIAYYDFYGKVNNFFLSWVLKLLKKYQKY